jgi:hypothetical protein
MMDKRNRDAKPPLKRQRAPAKADRQRQFRETARDILHMAKVKRQFGEAVDTAGAVARAMEQAYRLGFEDALKQATGSPSGAVEANGSVPIDDQDDAMAWTRIPPRTRSTFWSICLAALGREGRTETPSYLEMILKPGGTVAWQLMVPDRRTYDKSVGDGTIVTLVRLELLQHAITDEPRVTLSDYGIRTWNRFCERGGQWPDDLVEKLP